MCDRLDAEPQLGKPFPRATEELVAEIDDVIRPSESLHARYMKPIMENLGASLGALYETQHSSSGSEQECESRD
jgi:hypothetical protein